MDLSNFSYSHIYWIFLLPFIGADTYRWVFELTDAQTVLMYFWSKWLAEDFTARDFDLYAYDSIRGRMDKPEGLVE